jgi:hypothetical protein
MSKIEILESVIAKRTGASGAQLRFQTYCIAMLLAEATGNAKAATHFEKMARLVYDSLTSQA